MSLKTVFIGCCFALVRGQAWQSGSSGGWRGVPATTSQISNSPKSGWAPTVELKSDGWKAVSSGNPSATGWKSSSHGSRWQSRSAPIQTLSSGGSGSGGYSVTWVAPASPASSAPLTYGGQDPAWQTVPVGGDVWLPMAARSGLRPAFSRSGRWVQEDGHLVWETNELQTPTAASLTVGTTQHGWEPEKDQESSSFEVDPLKGHAVSWSWSRRGRDLLN